MCTVNLCRRLNLPLIARSLDNTQYNPEKYNPVIVRINNPKSTALIFSSGKVVCTGTRSKEEALKATRRFARLIYINVDCLIKFCNFRILNLVCSGSIGKSRVNLRDIYLNFEQCTYEPDLFPGMKIPILPLKNCNVVALLFHTGKIVITGAKYKKDVDFAFKYILDKL